MQRIIVQSETKLLCMPSVPIVTINIILI